MDNYIPLYIQLKNTIKERIDQREYLPGEKIPSEREMSERYGVNRMTVKKAVKALEEDGILTCIHGKGTFVSLQKDPRFIWGVSVPAENEGMSATMREAGITFESKVIAGGFLQARNYLASKLNIPVGAAVYTIQRVRYANEEPVAMEYAYLPMVYFDDIEQHNFEQTSLYAYMNARGHLPVNFQKNLIVMHPRDRELKYLNLEPQDTLYRFEYLGSDAEGNIVEYTESFMRTDKMIFRFQINA